MNESDDTAVMSDGTKLSGVVARFETNLAMLATLRCWPAVDGLRQRVEGAILSDVSELHLMLRELLYQRSLQARTYASLRRRIERLEQMKTNVKETCENRKP